MSEWKKVKLRDCCSKIGSGSTPKGGATVYIDYGTSLIRSQNVYNLYFDYDGLTHINEEAAAKLKSVTVLDGDILLNITGDSVARTCIVPKKVLPARVNQHVAIIRTYSSVISPQFLNYYLASPYMQAHMLGLAIGKGASRNAMTKTMIENFDVPCPPINIQHNIVTLLSRYDILIENYQQQIKLLEEAAQRLYKEWFVDLHFPGCENISIVDDVPDGWEKSDVNSILTFHRGYDLTHKEFVDGPYPVVGSTSIIGNHNKYKIEGPGIVTGRSGSLGVYQLIWDNYWPHNTSLYISDFKGHDVFYIYCLLKTVDFTTLNSGGAIPSLNRNTLSNISVMEPPMSLQANFSEKVLPMFKRQRHLQSQVQLLTEARDRLLPKLMSGEISVEAAQSVTSGLGVCKEQTDSQKATDS